MQRHPHNVRSPESICVPRPQVDSGQGRVLLKVVNPNVDVNVDVDVTFVNFAFY